MQHNNKSKKRSTMFLASICAIVGVLGMTSVNGNLKRNEQLQDNSIKETLSTKEETEVPSIILNSSFQFNPELEEVKILAAIEEVKIKKKKEAEGIIKLSSIKEEEEDVKEELPKKEPKKKKAKKKENKYVYYEVYDKNTKKGYALDLKLQEYTYDLCVEYGIEKYFPLILAQLFQESSYRYNLISKTNDYGIAQINKCNHSWLRKTLGITDFLDPKQSILANIYMMSGYLKEHNTSQALSKYNTGKAYNSTPYSRKILGILENDIRVKDVNYQLP